MRRSLFILIILVLCCGPATLAGCVVMLAGGFETANAQGCGQGVAAPQVTGLALTDEQLANAQTIVSTVYSLTQGPDVAMRASVRQHAAIVAVATALQESGLRNLPGGDRDSVGLFQQRVSIYPSDVATDPVKATTAFLIGTKDTNGAHKDGLLEVPDWYKMELWRAATSVQHPDPDYEREYAKWQALATELVARFWSGADAGSVDSLAVPGNLDQCLSTAGWTAPVLAAIMSGFGVQREDHTHQGVDFGAPSETPVRAAGAGEVITVACETDSSGRLCDRPGSLETRGCGWHVKIRHPGDVVTMYCHLIRAPMVRVGQVVVAGQEIGQVGQSGHSTGPHLHFEVRRVEGGREVSVDPVVFMREQGVELGVP